MALRSASVGKEQGWLPEGQMERSSKTIPLLLYCASVSITRGPAEITGSGNPTLTCDHNYSPLDHPLLSFFPLLSVVLCFG